VVNYRNAHIYSNVIDQAADGFTIGCCSDSDDSPSHGNVIDHNLVTNSVGVADASLDPITPTGPDPGVPIWTYWSGSAGDGNVYLDNLAYCASGFAHCGTSPGDADGLTYAGNIAANPQFADPNYQTSHDYRVTLSSPAASWGLWNGDAAPRAVASAKPAATERPAGKPRSSRKPKAITASLRRSRVQRRSHARRTHAHRRSGRVLRSRRERASHRRHRVRRKHHLHHHVRRHR
jgi:hypothetical protein